MKIASNRTEKRGPSKKVTAIVPRSEPLHAAHRYGILVRAVVQQGQDTEDTALRCSSPEHTLDEVVENEVPSGVRGVIDKDYS